MSGGILPREAARVRAASRPPAPVPLSWLRPGDRFGLDPQGAWEAVALSTPTAPRLRDILVVALAEAPIPLVLTPGTGLYLAQAYRWVVTPCALCAASTLCVLDVAEHDPAAVSVICVDCEPVLAAAETSTPATEREPS